MPARAPLNPDGGPRPPFHLFERVIARVSRYGVTAGDEGEVAQVFPDGSILLEVTERAGATARALLGSLADHRPYARSHSARFTPSEIRRPSLLTCSNLNISRSGG